MPARPALKSIPAGSIYTQMIELPEGTWARMWLMSGSDMVALGNLDATDMSKFGPTIERLSRACIEFRGPKPDQPLPDQPMAWLMGLVKGWRATTQEAAVPPALAES